MAPLSIGHAQPGGGDVVSGNATGGSGNSGGSGSSGSRARTRAAGPGAGGSRQSPYASTGNTPADTGGSTPIAPRPVPQQGPNRTSVSSVPTDPLPVYYGTMYRVGAQVWYEKVQPDGSIVVLYLICHGPINSIANITIEDKPLSTFNMVATTNYNIYTGTSSQTVDPLLTAAESTFTGAFPNVAYVVLKFPTPSITQPAPDWHRFLCDVQGMLVRDPRDNRILQSNALTNAAWTNSATVAASATAAPDGTLTAFDLTDNSAAVIQSTAQAATIGNNSNPHFWQLRVKKTSGGTAPTLGFDVQYAGGTALLAQLRLNTDTGAMLLSSTATWTVTSDPQSPSVWWLVRGYMANNSTGNVTFNFAIYPAISAYNVLGDTVAATGTATVCWPIHSALGVGGAVTFPGYTPTTSAAIIGDPTLVQRFYSDNPVLCIADFMTSPVRVAADGSSYPYGAGMPDAKLDWYGTITQATNDCNVLLADAVTKRFTMGYGITSKQPWDVHVQAMRGHAQLLFPQYNNGVYQIVMDKSQAAAAVTLTDAGPTANIVAVSPMTVKGSAQVPTHVECDFINPAALYKDDKAFDDDPIIATGGELVTPPSNYKFGVIPYDQAKRLAKYLRKRLAKDQSGTLYLLNDTGIQLLPGIRVPLTSAYYGFTAQDIIISSVKRVADPRWAFEAGWELYDANVYDDTQASGGAVAPPTQQSPFDPPQEIVNGIISSNGTGPRASIYWTAPQIRSTTLYDTTFWTALNLGTYDGTKVNDGVTTVNAFSFGATTAARLSADFGSAKAIRELWVYANGLNALVLTVEWSDNNSTWTDAVATLSNPLNFSGIYLTVFSIPVAAGSHRYWRIRKTTDTDPGSQAITEVWPREFLGTYNFAKLYNIYNMATADGVKFFDSIPASRTPSASLQIDLGPAIYIVNKTVTVKVTVVSAGGVESAGIEYNSTYV